MTLSILDLLVPLYVLIAAGFFFARFVSLSTDTLIRVTTDLFMPMLIFVSLYRFQGTSGSVLRLFEAGGFMICLLLVVMLLYSWTFHLDARAIVLPVVFMNTGFIGIPLMKLWSGESAMSYMVVLDQVTGLFFFTLGLFIVVRGFSAQGLKTLARSPLLWSIILGFLFHFARIPLPKALLSTFDFGGAAASPLAAFVLGCNLRTQKSPVSVHLLVGLFVRIVIGFAAGTIAVFLFHLGGVLKTVVLVGSALPSAVASFVVPQRYGVSVDFAGQMVLASTLLGAITIPLSLIVAGYISH